MSFGKLTLLSADCDGSGAVVGSSTMVADSSGAEGAGCAGVVVGVGAAAFTTPLTAITQINRLFGISHHSKTYGRTRTVRTVTPGQSQLRCSGGLPIGTPYDVTSALFRAQRIGDRR
jgi:hypothetical protein